MTHLSVFKEFENADAKFPNISRDDFPGHFQGLSGYAP